jgi:hypothetical protein
VLGEPELSDTTKGRPKMERGFFLNSRDRSVSPASKLAGQGQGRADGGDLVYTRSPPFKNVRGKAARYTDTTPDGKQILEAASVVISEIGTLVASR